MLSLIKKRLRTFIQFTVNSSVSEVVNSSVSEVVNSSVSEVVNSSVSEAFNQHQRLISYMGNNVGLTKTIYGHKMYVRTDDLSLSPHILLDGFWEKWITDVFRNEIQPGMKVIDIGANIGYYSLIASDLVGEKGHVTCFEANPETHEILFRNISVNGYLSRTNIINKAAYSENTTLDFNVLEKHQGSCSIFDLSDVEEQYLDKIKKIKVDAISLDEHLPKNSKVDFIKIDAEGAEIHILLGSKRILSENKNLIIMMEWAPDLLNHQDFKINDLYKFLTDIGFIFYKIEHDSSLKQASLDELLKVSHCDILLKRVKDA